MPKKLFKAVSEIPIRDRKGEFKQSMLFQGVDKIHISKTSDELAELDFADDGDDAASLPITRYISQIPNDYFYRAEKIRNKHRRKRRNLC